MVSAAAVERRPRAVDAHVVSVATLAVPTPDVLPRGVRRRLGARDAVLALVLVGELLAGVGLRAAWESREAVATWLVPAPSVAAVGPPVTATTWVLVPPVPAPPPPPPPPRRTAPRNPFEVQLP